MSKLEIINQEINTEISKTEVQTALLATTFKGLDVKSMKQALMEGMMRGFKFQDFLEKNVYAIPFKNTYSLITSIDYSRKVGMKSGVVGKSAPVYEMDSEGKKIISCSVTIKRKINEYVGEYTETVFFDEYNTGRNLWITKPRTMIAKVAEMHALRMACPEELAQAYIEEEMEKEVKNVPSVDITDYSKKLEKTKNMDELKKVWASIPVQAKQGLEELKENLKKKYENS